GRVVVVEGVTGPGDSGGIVIAASVTNVKPGILPAAEPVSPAQLSSPRYLRRRVEAGGIVRSRLAENDGRLTLNLVQDGLPFQARINASGAAIGDAFVDSRVSLRGVAHATFDMDGRPVRLQVLVPSLTDVIVQ